ncbi:MAG: hypothetical protein HY319_02085 [Armatimonadetes bacterium]|nr:hypothetical protein [Armatimonadota bacterium]
MKVTTSLTTLRTPARASSASASETPQDTYEASLPVGYRPTILGKLAIGAGALTAAAGMTALVAVGAPAPEVSGYLLAAVLAGTVGGVSAGVGLSMLANHQCRTTGNAATAFMTPVMDKEQAIFLARPDPDREPPMLW